MDKVVKIIKWLPIIGFPEYKVSSNGLIKKGRLLVNQRICKQHHGRFSVSLCSPFSGRPPKRFHVHLLVYDHFSDVPRMPGDEIHHKDLDYTNNDIQNLEKLTHDEHIAIHRNHRKISISNG